MGDWSQTPKADLDYIEWLERERGRLRAALEPFAAMADGWDQHNETCGRIPDDAGADGSIHPPARCPTVGQLRAAREALGG